MTENEHSKTESEMEPVFAKLPSEQKLSSDASAVCSPVTVHLPGSVRIEIGTGYPGQLLPSLFHELKAQHLKR